MIGYARAGLCGVGSFFIFLGGLLQINRIYNEDCLETMKRMADEFVNCVVTSPPYWGLRDYGVNGQIGLEKTPELYVEKMVEIFSEIKRVLKPDGTLWLILGDSYVSGKSRYSSKQHTLSGKDRGDNHNKKPDLYYHEYLKDKDLAGIPWRVAFALQADGWYLRSDIIWHKPNPMPESVTDRPTKSHEYIFLLTKSKKYYYDSAAIMEIATGYDGRKDTIFKGSLKYKPNDNCPRQGSKRWPNKARGFKTKKQIENPQHHGTDIPTYPGRNKRTVWTVNTKPFQEAHFAVFPTALIVDCIKAGCPKSGIVYDPFIGSGTTAEVALRLDRQFIGSELNSEYIKIAERRINSDKCKLPLFGAG